MRRLMFFLVGLLFGAAIGATLALFLTPAPGKTLRKESRGRFDKAMQKAHIAADDRRKELESQLSAMTRTPSKNTRERAKVRRR